jgi:hypothetical protein
MNIVMSPIRVLLVRIERLGDLDRAREHTQHYLHCYRLSCYFTFLYYVFYKLTHQDQYILETNYVYQTYCEGRVTFSIL